MEIVTGVLRPASPPAVLPLRSAGSGEVGGAKSIEVQTNDTLLTLMLYDRAERIECSVILFHDGVTTHLSVPGVVFVALLAGDRDGIACQKLGRGRLNGC